jgi:hypothetical protein
VSKNVFGQIISRDSAGLVGSARTLRRDSGCPAPPTWR